MNQMLFFSGVGGIICIWLLRKVEMRRVIYSHKRLKVQQDPLFNGFVSTKFQQRSASHKAKTGGPHCTRHKTNPLGFKVLLFAHGL